MEDRKDNYQLIGNYEIQNMIGRGFYGLVFKAKKQDAVYAVRFMPKNFIQQSKYDLNLLIQIQNEHLVKTLEIIEDKNNFYVIMEHCSEGNLASLLTQNKLEDDSLIDITQQILKGFQILFKNNISAINIKPRNVLIKNGKFKISDYGLLCSKSMNQNGSNRNQTRNSQQPITQQQTQHSQNNQQQSTQSQQLNQENSQQSGVEPYSEEQNFKVLAELIYFIVQTDRLHLLGGNGEVKQHYRLNPIKVNQMESIKKNLLEMMKNSTSTQQISNIMVNNNKQEEGQQLQQPTTNAKTSNSNNNFISKQQIKELLFNREAFLEDEESGKNTFSSKEGKLEVKSDKIIQSKTEIEDVNSSKHPSSVHLQTNQQSKSSNMTTSLTVQSLTQSSTVKTTTTRQFKSLPCITQPHNLQQSSVTKMQVIDCRSKSVLGPKPLMMMQALGSSQMDDEIFEDDLDDEDDEENDKNKIVSNIILEEDEQPLPKEKRGSSKQASTQSTMTSIFNGPTMSSMNSINHQKKSIQSMTCTSYQKLSVCSNGGIGSTQLMIDDINNNKEDADDQNANNINSESDNDENDNEDNDLSIYNNPKKQMECSIEMSQNHKLSLQHPPSSSITGKSNNMLPTSSNSQLPSKSSLKEIIEFPHEFQSLQQQSLQQMQQKSYLELYEKEKSRGMYLYQTREYKFAIGVYQFIGDAIDAVSKLDSFNENKKNVLSYILAKLYLVKAMSLRDSLVLRQNSLGLDLFEQFCQSGTGQYLIEYMDKNIETYEHLLHEYYSHIDFKINKNLAQQLLEKDFYQVTSEQEITMQVRSTLEIAQMECLERVKKRCLSVTELEDYLCAALYLFIVIDCNKIFLKSRLKQNFPYYFAENNHFEFKLLKKWLNSSSHQQLMDQLNYFLAVNNNDNELNRK